MSVGIRLPPLALDDGARLSATRSVGRARHGIAELSVGILRIFLHDASALETLLVAQLDATQVQHTVLHRREHFLPLARGVALVQRRNYSKREVQAGAA